MGTALLAFWTAHSAVFEAIAAAILPSLITAASKRPQTAGIVPALQWVLRRLSVLTHTDDAGTLKAPLTDGRS